MCMSSCENNEKTFLKFSTIVYKMTILFHMTGLSYLGNLTNGVYISHSFLEETYNAYLL